MIDTYEDYRQIEVDELLHELEELREIEQLREDEDYE